MRKLFQKILSLIMSIFMSIGIPTTIIANNDTEQDVFACGMEEDEIVIQQMLAEWNQIPSDDFGGYYINGGTEIVIKGFKARGYGASTNTGYMFECDKEVLRIPDEIDGVPVTTIAEHAFKEGFWGSHYGWGMSWSDVKTHTLIVGNNVKTIKHYGVYDIRNVVIGKNATILADIVETDSFPNLIINSQMCENVYCYENSEIHKYLLKWNDFYEGYTDIHFIDESHLTSKTATIDDELNIRGLPSGLTKETVKDYVSVDGDAIMEISDDVITTGTTIELINREYGLID
ncbi:MAG: hypothetical protein IJB86_07955, partial [Clostridia bacterium]|nr:hypothetical protein [Clostridia bacterium]